MYVKLYSEMSILFPHSISFSSSHLLVNKRLDEWVDADRFDFTTLHSKPFSKKEDPSGKKMTRSRKKSTNDIHVPKGEEVEKVSQLEKEHQEITKVCCDYNTLNYIY
jgi:hypothetical protein